MMYNIGMLHHRFSNERCGGGGGGGLSHPPLLFCKSVYIMHYNTDEEPTNCRISALYPPSSPVDLMLEKYDQI